MRAEARTRQGSTGRAERAAACKRAVKRQRDAVGYCDSPQVNRLRGRAAGIRRGRVRRSRMCRPCKRQIKTKQAFSQHLKAKICQKSRRKACFLAYIRQKINFFGFFQFFRRGGVVFWNILWYNTRVRRIINETRLRHMKNEAHLWCIKRAFGTLKGEAALRFIFCKAKRFMSAKPTLHCSFIFARVRKKNSALRSRQKSRYKGVFGRCYALYNAILQKNCS